MLNVSQEENSASTNANDTSAEAVPLQQINKNVSGSKMQTNAKEDCNYQYIYIYI